MRQEAAVDVATETVAKVTIAFERREGCCEKGTR
jgi:hypothetical protein